MPIVDENRLKGIAGAFYVATFLSRKCLVRTVSGDTDIGIDLYCESVEGRDAHLHFWLQVKSGTQCSFNAADNLASCSFDVDHIRYWQRQPVPVYAALVPKTESSPIFIVNVTQRELSEQEAVQQTVTLRSDMIWNPGDQGIVEEFLFERVPTDTALLSLRNGMFAKVPHLTPSYEIRIPIYPVRTHLETIKRQIRRTAASTILSLHRYGGLYELRSDRALFREILEGYCRVGQGGNWETHMALGLIYHADSEFDKATAQYEEAASCIVSDSNLAGPDWNSRVDRIRTYLERARNHETIENIDTAIY